VAPTRHERGLGLDSAATGAWLADDVDAQRLYEQALLGYARAKGQRYLDTILLFEAMGGTWRAPPPIRRRRVPDS